MSGPVYAGDAGLDARIADALATPTLAVTLGAVRDHTLATRAGIEARHPDWPARVERARRIRLDGVRRMDELLDRFEARLRENGGTLVRAATAADAVAAVVAIARRRGAHLVAKGKSMVSEEIDLNQGLEAAGLVPVETDLGEWVAQLAGERPSHIIAPILHRNRAQVADVLSAEAGRTLADDPAGLVAFARERMRETFANADLGITGANFLVAETGAAIVIENEGNGRLVTSLPRCHVVVTGVEKIVETATDAAFLVQQTTIAAVARDMPSYVSWLAGPARDGDDGPEEMVVVVLDGGRRALVGSETEDILTCVRCGACLSICPVYGKVGGHAYGSVYSGPVGAVLTPLLEGMAEDRGRKLPFLSSLCGACTDICPVGIPLHDLLVRDRVRANASGQASRSARAAWRAWAMAWSSPVRYRASARLGTALRPLARAAGPGATWAQERGAPPAPARRPFHQRWSDLERQA